VTEINEAWMQRPCAALMNYALNAAVLHTALPLPQCRRHTSCAQYDGLEYAALPVEPFVIVIMLH
jgi:hypothetical protein